MMSREEFLQDLILNKYAIALSERAGNLLAERGVCIFVRIWFGWPAAIRSYLDALNAETEATTPYSLPVRE
jgi:hypothetical protein